MIGTSDGKIYDSEFDYVFDQAQNNTVQMTQEEYENRANTLIHEQKLERLKQSPILDKVHPFEGYDDSPTLDQNIRDYRRSLRDYQFFMDGTNPMILPTPDNNTQPMEQEWNPFIGNNPYHQAEIPVQEDSIPPNAVQTSGEVPAETVEEGSPDMSFWASIGDKLLGRGQQRFKLWPERVVTDAFDNIYNFVNSDLTTKEGIRSNIGTVLQAGFDLATLGTSVAAKGSAGIFGGKLSQGLDATKYNRALQMERRGHSEKEIWEETGFFKGGDEQWRYEMSDKDVLIHPDIIQKTNSPIIARLGRVLKHPELYKAYPELKDMPITLDSRLNARGEYTSYLKDDKGNITNRSIKLNPTAFKDISDAKGTLVHEIQHAIQDIEGFISGSSPAYSFMRADESLSKKIINIEVDALESLQKKLGREPNSDELFALLEKNPEYVEYKTLKDFLWQGSGMFGDFAMHLYKRNPGEIEARLAQLRENWEPSVRKSISPLAFQRELIKNGMDEFKPFRFPSEQVDPATVSMSVKDTAKETVKESAIIVNGETFTGPSHFEAWNKAVKKYPEIDDNIIGPFEEGFMTSSGRFVDRKEALKIFGGDPKEPGILISEDLKK